MAARKRNGNGSRAAYRTGRVDEDRDGSRLLMEQLDLKGPLTVVSVFENGKPPLEYEERRDLRSSSFEMLSARCIGQRQEKKNARQSG